MTQRSAWALELARDYPEDDLGLTFLESIFESLLERERDRCLAILRQRRDETRLIRLLSEHAEILEAEGAELSGTLMHWLELDRLQAQSVSVVSRLFQHYLDREQVEEVRVYGWRLFQLLSDQPTSQFQHAKVLQQWLASEPSKRIDVLGVLIANEPDEELHWIALRESAIAGNDRSIYLRALPHRSAG